MSTRLQKITRVILSFILLTSYFAFYPLNTEAALASQAQVQMSDSRPSHAATTYTMTFVHGSTSASLKCIVIQFALNADMSGGAPTGMTTTSAVKGTLSGTGITNANYILYDGFNNATTNGYLQFENSTGDSITAGNYATASATTITNPSITSFYAQITTYTAVGTHTCTSQLDQSNVIAISTVPGVTTTVTVSPTLTVSVAGLAAAVNGSGDTVNLISTATSMAFGTVAAGVASSAAQTVTVSTNAANGYRLYVSDTGTMADSNADTLRDQAGTPASPNTFDGSTSQSSFAYTALGNGVVFGSNKWAGLGSTQTQYLIAFRTTSINADGTNIEYKVLPSNVQPPGAYSTTVVYTAVPSY